MRTAKQIEALIGSTPLVDLSDLANGNAIVLGKYEATNPGGSIKDRIAKAIVEDAEKKGLLAPGGTIIEPTSGNTGVGLAMVAAQRGYKLKNISEEFGCTIISCKPNIRAQKVLMRKFFEKYGKPTWYVDRLIYTFPLHMAAKFNTPMLCYGENVSFEYGGCSDKETYSAMDQIENGVAVGFPMEELVGDGVTENDLSLTLAPSAEERAKLDPFYMSYFVPWNSYKNYQIAKEHGFHDLTHEWDRTHHAENFDQIDSRAYLVHSWLKYPKFGHAAATDYTARYIRYGMMTREEAIPIIKARDGKLDPLCVRDFCDFCGYTESEFWKIMDKFYNRDLFEKNDCGEWVLKHPIWEENK